MNKKLPTFTYNNKLNSTTLNVIVHGGNAGIDDPFLQKVYTRIIEAKQSYIAIQLPFKDRGDEKSSGTETLEEIEAVQSALESISTDLYTNIHFIGKSLGGLVLQRFIAQSDTFNIPEVTFTILGYLVGDIQLSQLKTKLYVIQGSNDPYGDYSQVKKEIERSQTSYNELHVIDGADHSYRNNDKVPAFQDEVISLIKL